MVKIFVFECKKCSINLKFPKCLIFQTNTLIGTWLILSKDPKTDENNKEISHQISSNKRIHFVLVTVNQVLYASKLFHVRRPIVARIPTNTKMSAAFSAWKNTTVQICIFPYVDKTKFFSRRFFVGVRWYTPPNQ